MKSNYFSAGSSLLLLTLLSGCVSMPTVDWAGTEQLSPCALEGGPFENMNLEKWPETYHGTVSKVIDAHVEKLKNISTADITCSAEDYASMLKASEPLRTLASSLEPWKDGPPSELEAAPVLMEYLRLYECALEDRRYFLSLGARQRSSASSATSSSSSSAVGYGEYIDQEGEDATLINRELGSARLILERTLSIAGGLDRLHPLSADIECIKRASLDLRNTLGLTAEAMSCMPRALDIRGSLRDLASSSSAPTP